MMSIDHQEQIFYNVDRRGFLRGWSFREFCQRQAVKLLEEACEFFMCFPWPKTRKFREVYILVVNLQIAAKSLFKDNQAWIAARPLSGEVSVTGAMGELADVVVTASCAAQSLRTLRKPCTSICLMGIALEKSAADISRGTGAACCTGRNGREG